MISISSSVFFFLLFFAKYYYVLFKIFIFFRFFIFANSKSIIFLRFPKKKYNFFKLHFSSFCFVFFLCVCLCAKVLIFVCHFNRSCRPRKFFVLLVSNMILFAKFFSLLFFFLFCLFVFVTYNLIN